MAFRFSSIYLDSPIVKGRVMDIFSPRQITRDTAIFFIHGGGWQVGTRTDFHTLMQAFNAEGYLCASTDYRSAANDLNMLDQITDVRHAYDEFISYLKENDRPLKVFVIGSSAGAHLAEILAYAAPEKCGESLEYKGRKLHNKWICPFGVTAICAPVTLLTWEDIFPEIQNSIKNALGTSFEDNPELYKRLSPETYLSSDLCPTFFICAEDEYIFPNRLVESFVAELCEKEVKAKYKIYPRVEHGFMYGLDRWQQKEGLKDIMNFIESL